MDRAAGWYEDPDTHAERWWTGTEWGITKDIHERLLSGAPLTPTPAATPATPAPLPQTPDGYLGHLPTQTVELTLPQPVTAPGSSLSSPPPPSGPAKLPPPAAPPQIQTPQPSIQPTPQATPQQPTQPPAPGILLLPSPTMSHTATRDPKKVMITIAIVVVVLLAGVVGAVVLRGAGSQSIASVVTAKAQRIVHDMNTNNQADLCFQADGIRETNCKLSSSTTTPPTSYHNLTVHVVEVDPSGAGALVTLTGSACVNQLCVTNTDPRQALVSTDFRTNNIAIQSASPPTQKWALIFLKFTSSWRLYSAPPISPLFNGTPVAGAVRVPSAPIVTQTEAQWYTSAHPTYQAAIQAMDKTATDAKTYQANPTPALATTIQADCNAALTAGGQVMHLPTQPYSPGGQSFAGSGFVQGYDQGAAQGCAGAPLLASTNMSSSFYAQEMSTGFSEAAGALTTMDQAAATLAASGA